MRYEIDVVGGVDELMLTWCDRAGLAQAITSYRYLGAKRDLASALFRCSEDEKGEGLRVVGFQDPFQDPPGSAGSILHGAALAELLTECEVGEAIPPPDGGSCPGESGEAAWGWLVEAVEVASGGVPVTMVSVGPSYRDKLVRAGSRAGT